MALPVWPAPSALPSKVHGCFQNNRLAEGLLVSLVKGLLVCRLFLDNLLFADTVKSTLIATSSG